MAVIGGGWFSHKKVIPGSHINFVSTVKSKTPIVLSAPDGKVPILGNDGVLIFTVAPVTDNYGVLMFATAPVIGNDEVLIF